MITGVLVDIDPNYFTVILGYDRDLHVADPNQPTPIIVSAFTDQAQAKTHKNTIKNDRLRSILDLHDDNHRKMILHMIEGTRYLVYWTKLST